MDPLSIIASSLTIITAVRGAVTAARILYEAPEQVDSLLNDLTECEILIRTVGTTLQDKAASETASNRIPLNERERLSNKLKRTTDLSEELRLLINTQISRSGLSTKVKRTSWVVAKRKVSKLKRKLEGVCEGLRVALGEYKTSQFELELQYVSLLVSDLRFAHKQSIQEGKDATQSISRILDNQQSDSAQNRSNQEETTSLAQAAVDLSTKTYEKVVNIEHLLLTDNLKPSPSRPRVVPEKERQMDPNEEQNVPGTLPEERYVAKYERVAVRAGHRASFFCRADCPCLCHTKSNVYFPETLRSLLGQLFAGYSGKPAIERKPCSHSDCVRKRTPSTNVTYYFPRWWVAQKMLKLVAKMTALGGPQMTLEFPRIVPATARIFREALTADIDSVRDLFSAGLASPADVDATTGATPLAYACWAGNEQSINYLLHRGANRNFKSFAGFSPIEETWSRLLTDSVDPVQRSALERVCDEETLETFEFTDFHRSVVKLSPVTIETEIRALLRSSASIDDTDSGGRTALSWAAQRGDISAVKILLEHGADPNKSPPDSKTPLIYATGLTSTADCAKSLLEFGASESVHDPAGLTPLMWSCLNSRDNYSNLTLLLNSSDLELVDQNSRTALFHAASANPRPTQMLIDKGCNINHTDNEGYTALLISIAYNRSRILNVLLEAGADYTLKIRSGQGTLHQAAHFADLLSLQVLQGAKLVGLDVDDCDKEGCNPIDILKSRVPRPPSEIVDKFHKLVDDIERHNSAIYGSRVTSSTESTLEWETASEGNIILSDSDEE
ncbi:ankyrin [Viridothelium virens]|uniref:Ankyrin n=1 Tax=Viridothelium virens TaxID=1048519 RepID=A0A6A6GYL7_VIRVR|nr:ankyrin [Viridothelium virens]